MDFVVKENVRQGSALYSLLRLSPVKGNMPAVMQKASDIFRYPFPPGTGICTATHEIQIIAAKREESINLFSFFRFIFILLLIFLL